MTAIVVDHSDRIQDNVQINVGSTGLGREVCIEAMIAEVASIPMRLDRPQHDWSWTPGRRNRGKKG